MSARLVFPKLKNPESLDNVADLRAALTQANNELLTVFAAFSDSEELAAVRFDMYEHKRDALVRIVLGYLRGEDLTALVKPLADEYTAQMMAKTSGVQ